MPNRNGVKWAGAIGVGVLIAVLGDSVISGLTDWRSYPGLVRDVARAEEKAEECCTNSEENARSIVAIQGDVKHTKEKVDETARDIKQINRNLNRLLGALEVEPAPEEEPE